MFDASGNKLGSELVAGSGVEPTITSLSTGGFVVSWRGVDADRGGIKAQIFDASGSKIGGEFLVNTATLNEQIDPNITSLASGEFLVTWTDFNGDADGSGVKAQIFDAGGNKIGGEFLINTVTASGQSESAVASLPTGGFVVSWTYGSGDDPGGDGSNTGVKAQIFDASGNKIGGELLVNITTQGPQQQSSITSLPSGGFVISWRDFSADFGGEVRAQVFDGGGNKVGGEMLVNTTTAGSQLAYGIATLPSGGFIVTWTDFRQDNDGSGSSVRGQMFDASGKKVGTDFVINTTTSNFQTTPAVTALTSGELVVSWTDSSGQGGDSSGRSVKAQIFAEADQTLRGDGGNNVIIGGSRNDLFLL